MTTIRRIPFDPPMIPCPRQVWDGDVRDPMNPNDTCTAGIGLLNAWCPDCKGVGLVPRKESSDG